MPLQDEITQLLSLPEDGAGAPSLAALESTLTEGYARALALEAECWRIQRRLGELARNAADSDSARELAALSRRLAKADGELAKLRALLGSLQQRARTLRSSS